jgi:hypothetical protein
MIGSLAKDQYPRPRPTSGGSIKARTHIPIQPSIRQDSMFRLVLCAFPAVRRGVRRRQWQRVESDELTLPVSSRRSLGHGAAAKFNAAESRGKLAEDGFDFGKGKFAREGGLVLLYGDVPGVTELPEFTLQQHGRGFCQWPFNGNDVSILCHPAKLRT